MLLRHGAYAIFNDDASAAERFQEADIESILGQSTVIRTGDLAPRAGERHQLRDNRTPFSKVSFAADGCDRTLDVDDPSFWEKALGLSKARQLVRSTQQGLSQLSAQQLASFVAGEHPDCRAVALRRADRSCVAAAAGLWCQISTVSS
jgi:hypothetical protein